MWVCAQRGQPGNVLIADRVPVGAQPVDGGVYVAGVPQHHGVETRPSASSWPSG